MKTLFRVALVLSLTTVGATPTFAAATEGPGDEITTGVRIVNNYTAAVRVYAEDGEGALHKLGRVAMGELVEFEIPAELAHRSFRIKVFPSQPVWSLEVDDYAVKTSPLDLETLADVTVWLEPNLADSLVEMRRSQ